MKFAIITFVPHILKDSKYYAYSPYVREMNVWSKYAKEIILVAPQVLGKLSPIENPYNHKNINFIKIDSFDVLNLKSIVLSIYKIPRISWHIFSAMQKADHIHLRCPGNVGLLGCFIQILFPNKPKTAKYAGNWDSKSKQPWTYKLQRWILNNTFLTRNMKVLVYGNWEGVSKNVVPFFTATYSESDKVPLQNLMLNSTIDFIFVGTLVSGKRPLYAIQLVEDLYRKGFDVRLRLFGEGVERGKLMSYIMERQLQNIISLQGNQNSDTVKKAYQNSHFVVLPSESEGWPKVIAEGMFWGCVPISSSVSCTPYMLNYGERGVLLTMDLENDVRQIETLLSNVTDFDKKRIEASNWSRKYTLDFFEKEILEILNSK